MCTMQEKDIIDEIQNSRNRYRKIIQAGIAKWVKDFQEGRIKIESVDDLRKLVEMDIELQRDNYFLAKRINRKIYNEE